MVEDEFNCRRDFFRQLVPRAARLVSTLSEELQGRPQMLLTDLARYPDAVLRDVIPVFGDAVQWGCHEGRIHVHDEAGELAEAWSISAVDEQALQLFDCGWSLEQIAHAVESESTDGVERYPGVKALFLGLCRRAICHPLQSLADCEPDRTP